MKLRNSTNNWMPPVAALVLLSWFAVLPTGAGAQTGYNIVQQGAGTIASPSFIDALTFTGTDVCARIYAAVAYSGYPTGGRVVDARGLNSTNTTMTCASGSTPWVQGSNSTTHAADILLPAGAITINTTWIVPSQTHIIGEGRGKTTIAAASGFSGDMIDFGSSALCPTQCFAIGVSGMIVDGGGQLINGIVNNNAGEQSYVDEVSIHYVEGASPYQAGLYIGNGGNNSGPYSNLSITAGGTGCGTSCNPQTTTACVRIVGASTRGVHGVTCTSNFTPSGGPSAGIYLDGYNNTIEDAHFEGVGDGIVVGATGSSAGNVVLNITGSGGGSTSGQIDNIVHICSPTSSAAPCSSSSGPVTDLSLLGIMGNQAQFHTVYMIKDDVTGTSIPAPAYPGQGFVGLYVLGEQIASGYSRFTTAPGFPTWGVGAASPGSSCSSPGSLYSNTAGGAGTTLYVCVSSLWTNIK